MSPGRVSPRILLRQKINGCADTPVLYRIVIERNLVKKKCIKCAIKNDKNNYNY